MPTTTEVAALLGCSRDTIVRLCRAHQIGRRESIGLILSPEDIERLRPLVSTQRGNPRIGQESARGVAARQKKRKQAKRAAKK